jgi:hypothetical protein
MLEWAPIVAAIALLLAGVWWYADTEAAGDALTISEEGIVSHLWNARERAAALAMGAVSFQARELMVALLYGQWLTLAVVLAQVATLFGILGSFFWVWFDIRINLRREKEWNYIGQNAQSDLMASRLFKGATTYTVVKSGVFLLMCVAYCFATRAL